MTFEIERPSWMYDAACRGMPPSVFFPDRGQQAQLAKRVCAECGVFDACREYGVRSGEEGVFGGLSDRERQAERRRRGIVLRHNAFASNDRWNQQEEGACERAS